MENIQLINTDSFVKDSDLEYSKSEEQIINPYDGFYELCIEDNDYCDYYESYDEYLEYNSPDYQEQLLIAESQEFAFMIIDFIKIELNKNHKLEPWEIYELVVKEFPFINESSLNFNDATLIDKYFFGKCGSYWRSAYNFPKELDDINCHEQKLSAYDVGIFTFNY